MTSIFFVLKNFGVISSALASIESLVGEIAKSDRKLPSVQQTQKLLDVIHNLIKAKVIDIPDVDDEKVFEAFQTIAINLVAAIDGGHQNIDRFGDAQPRFGAGVPQVSVAKEDLGEGKGEES